jgi:hypothetical protein
MIPCYCIDDQGRPEVIPISKWPKLGHKYHVMHIYKQVLQYNQLAFVLKEISLKGCEPYNAFLSHRFAFEKKDLLQLRIMMQATGELNDIQIDSLLEELTTEKINSNE